MKLFENGVGRPTNEIKKLRMGLILSTISIIISVLVVLTSIIILNINTSKLKGISVLRELELVCASNKEAGESFICSTNQTGVRISGPKAGLAKGYTPSFKTKKGALTKTFKYTKAGNIIITASKVGYDTVTQKVKIKLNISCPYSNGVGEQFTCTTNEVGVKLTISKDGLSKGYFTSFVSKSNNKSIKAKYTKETVVKVTATKSNYPSNTKYVLITSKTSSNSKDKTNEFLINIPSNNREPGEMTKENGQASSGLGRKTTGIDPEYKGSVWKIDGGKEGRKKLEALIAHESSSNYISCVLIAQQVRDYMMYRDTPTHDPYEHPFTNLSYDKINDNVKKAVEYVFDEGGSAIQHRIYYNYSYLVSGGRSKFFESQKFVYKYEWYSGAKKRQICMYDIKD